jgi:hypothetical protein
MRQKENPINKKCTYIRKDANIVGKDENLEEKRIHEFKLNLFPPLHWNQFLNSKINLRFTSCLWEQFTHDLFFL